MPFRLHERTPTPSDESRPNGSPHLRVRVTVLGALGLLAMALTLGAFAQARVDRRGLVSARLINLAGRQRMLSQVIARDAAATLAKTSPARTAENVRRMNADYDILKRTIDSLVESGASGLSATRLALEKAQGDRISLVYAATALAQGAPGAMNHAAQATASADAFLPQMEATVSAIQHFSEADASSTLQAAQILNGSMLVLLFLTALLVVEPTVRVIRRQYLDNAVRTRELERLSMAARCTTNAVLFLDADCNITWVNHGFTVMSGYTLDEVVGKHPRDILPSANADRAVLQDIDTAVTSGRGFSGEIINRHKDGHDFWIDLDIQPVVQGEQRGFIIIQTDVTEQVAQRNRLQSIFESLSEGVVFASAQGGIMDCNGAAERILGLSLAQMRGRATVDARWGSIRQDGTPLPPEETPVMRTIATGIGERGFVHGVRLPSGDRRWVSVSTEPIRAPDGSLSGVVASFADVTASLDRDQRMELVVSAASLGTWDVHIPSGRTTFNEQCAAMLGYRLADFGDYEKSWRALVHPDDLPRVEESLRAHARGLAPEYRCEHRLHRKDGSWAWVLGVGRFTERGPNGEPIRAAGVNIDISHARALEEQASATQARFDAAIAGTSSGLWDWSKDTAEIWFAPRCWELLGFVDEASRVELTSASCVERMHPDDREATVAACLAELKEGITCDVQLRLRVASGEYQWFRLRCKAQRDGNGRALRLAGAIQDIQQQKLAEAALIKTTASLEEAQTVAGVGNWELELATGTSRWSKHVYAMFDRNPALGPPDVAGLLSGFVDEDAARLDAAMIKTATQGTSYSIVLRKRDPSHAVRFMRVDARARHNADGEIVALFGTCTDVTRETDREEALQEARAEAEASHSRVLEINRILEDSTAHANELAARAEMANQSKSEFLANMSHEIRTPLTAILGFTDVLREELAEQGASARSTGAITTIQRAGEHLITVINDILDLSKIEAGRLEVEQIDTDLPRVLLDVDSLMRARAAAKGVTLRSTLATPVPQRVLTDPTRLRQILMNLVGNAAKFTSHGSISVRTLVATDGPSPMLRIEVEDTGPGMTETQAALLFQPFSQADASVTRKYGGTGLGLTICRRLATLMGGSVRLDYTSLGRGSRFAVELPLIAAPNAPQVTSLESCVSNDKQKQTGAAVVGATLHGRILLAEDGEDNQRLITFHLNRAGADVTVAANGRIALELLQQAIRAGQPYDLLITDIQMPEMDGYTLTRTIRAQKLVIPIVALTAHAMAEDRRQCLAAGCDDYATKPIDRAVLLSTCARWMTPTGTDDAIFPAAAVGATSAAATGHGDPATAEATTARIAGVTAATNNDAQDLLYSDLADDPDMVELIAQFVHDLEARVSNIQSCALRSDWSALSSAAHQLKGAAGGYGYTPISDAARLVERVATQSSTADEREDAIAALIAKCHAAMRGQLSSTSPSESDVTVVALTAHGVVA